MSEEQRNGAASAERDGLEETLTPQELRQEVASGLILDILQERRSERRWKRIRRIGTAALVLMGGFLYLASYAGMLGYRALPVSDTVAVVPINGTIALGAQASADSVNPLLLRLFEADKVKGIVLLINSGGGSPSEAERITRLIDEQRAKTGKPVYAACAGICASAAYMIALHADRIYAGEYSWAGSIGAIMKGWDFKAVLQKFEIDQAEQKLRLNLHIWPADKPEFVARTSGAHLDPRKLSGVTPADMAGLKGCDVYFDAVAAGFSGAMKKGACAFAAPNGSPIYSWSQMILTPTQFSYLDGWFNLDGTVFQKFAGDWYVFDKIK